MQDVKPRLVTDAFETEDTPKVAHTASPSPKPKGKGKEPKSHKAKAAAAAKGQKVITLTRFMQQKFHHSCNCRGNILQACGAWKCICFCLVLQRYACK